MCKIEYEAARDPAVATIVEEKNNFEMPNSPGLERMLKPEKLFDITNSPVPIEKAMNELELSPVAAKGRPGLFEYDVVHGKFNKFGKFLIELKDKIHVSYNCKGIHHSSQITFWKKNLIMRINKKKRGISRIL